MIYVTLVHPDQRDQLWISQVLGHHPKTCSFSYENGELKCGNKLHQSLFSVDVMVEFQLSPKKETLKISVLFFILFTASNSFLTIRTFIY